MVATDRGQRLSGRHVLAATLAFSAVVSGGLPAFGQGVRKALGIPPRAAAQPTAAPAAAAANTPQAARPGQVEEPRFEVKAIPVSPTDAIAYVNNEPITRQQLADECVAREGKKVLDTLIARRLIEQEMRKRKLEVTAAEIDEEIEATAARLGNVSRDVWLRTLDKERGISPAMYARDIIFPSIALRKLASPRVQVTEEDIRASMEANFGEKMHCRIIMTDKSHTAIEIWEELKKNPNAFEKLARDRSRDSSTAALGGLLPEPIARHAYPRPVSDAAFDQLVDGDRKDTDPTHKPKDGDVSGPIQVNDVAWVIIKREKLIPGKPYDKNDPALRASLHKQMFDVKLQEAMTDLMNDLMKQSAVKNMLTGREKEANEEETADFQAAKDTKVKLMAGEAPTTRPGTASTGVRSTAPSEPTPAIRAGGPPAGVGADVADQAETLRKPIAAPR